MSLHKDKYCDVCGLLLEDKKPYHYKGFVLCKSCYLKEMAILNKLKCERCGKHLPKDVSKKTIYADDVYVLCESCEELWVQYCKKKMMYDITKYRTIEEWLKAYNKNFKQFLKKRNEVVFTFT